MRTLLPSLLLLAACTPPPPDLSALAKELAALRQGMEELKKAQQPTFDKEQVLEDLTKEVRRLRAAPAAPAAPAPAPAVVPAGNLPASSLAGGVGGTQPGINDLYWVLAKVQVEAQDRTVLALYKATANGFKLQAVRMLGADLQIVDYGQDRPHVREILDELKKEKR